MRHSILLAISFMLIGSASAFAETVEIAPGLTLALELPSARWAMSREIPAFLAEEMAEHLRHEIPPDKVVDDAQIKEMVRKRLEVNELFIYSLESGAHLEIDFSPLHEGEKAPSPDSLADSARYAGQSLADEEGVSAATSEVSRAEIAGARAAYRLDARYDFHGAPRRFTGVIGFAAPYWFFLYYTDPLKNPADGPELEKLLSGIVLRPAGTK